ncbi:MAG TPA: hypothetical protein VL096_04295, partial [Pirellulaceae bacterium]|nr:hypothetical protein [Pirellulaceae bacterium]
GTREPLPWQPVSSSKPSMIAPRQNIAIPPGLFDPSPCQQRYRRSSEHAPSQASGRVTIASSPAKADFGISTQVSRSCTKKGRATMPALIHCFEDLSMLLA